MALRELSLLSFLTPPGGKYDRDSSFRMRRPGLGEKSSRSERIASGGQALPKGPTVIQSQPALTCTARSSTFLKEAGNPDLYIKSYRF